MFFFFFRFSFCDVCKNMLRCANMNKHWKLNLLLSFILNKTRITQVNMAVKVAFRVICRKMLQST